MDDDGWGADAPQVSRTQLEKVESAYKPTKVNMAELSKGRDESTRHNGGQQDDRPGVVRGAYQPIGKVDIAAIRAQAQNKGDDFRPTPVKGSYEPVGKVDIAAIRARSQKPAEAVEETQPEQPKSLAERTAAFTQSERLTELPKPKVAKKFGGAAAFTGTKAPTPAGFGAPAVPGAPPVGAASRTFADQGGKTPAQLWAEKKAKERGGAAPSPGVTPPLTSPVTAQKSGGEGWRSGYAGKSWGPIQTTNFGRGGVETQKTGGTERSEGRSEPEVPASPAGGISAIRDRFKDAQPMGASAAGSRQVLAHEEEEHAPPPLPSNTRPSGGFALPGLPSRPAVPAAEQEEEEDEAPPVPNRDYEEEREHSPIPVALPVARSKAVELEPPAERSLPPPLPTHAVEEELPAEEDIPHEEETHDPRAAAAAVAQQSFGHEQVAGAGSKGGKRAVIQYDYEKAEDNEIDLIEGEEVTNIEMVDDDWWMGTNSRGESGLFPSNYVELVEGGDEPAAASGGHSAPAPPPAAAAAEPEPAAEATGGATATALFDYEAAEDNGTFAFSHLKLMTWT